MATRLHFLEKLDTHKTTRLANPASSIVFYDRKLLAAVPGFRAWLKNYPHNFALTAGEKLKSLESFGREAARVQRSVGSNVTRSWTVVAIGGGSVGDFGGFFASVYKRGLPFVQIPTTWLAAIDSSHGGKTALNLSGAKNQIGTFYPAVHTILIRQVLQALPERSLEDAMGEFLKIALIDGRTWTKGFTSRPSARAARAAWMWRKLPMAIDAKMRIVHKDPFETRGDRQLLNLGHTFGHVLEANLGLSHGKSVGQGLLFALEFSEVTGAISTPKAEKIRIWLESLGIRRNSFRISRAAARRLLQNDKKRDQGNFVWFLVIRDFGKIERRRVDVDQILEVADLNGWLK